MGSRRKFIKDTAITIVGSVLLSNELISQSKNIFKLSLNKSKKTSFPLVISTWNHGLAANESAWKILINHGRALDAVETGVRVSEDDPNVRSVGYGGLPDRDGNVTLDACIMDEYGNCGSVAFLQHIKNPISVARLVMEKTPHIMLVGDGALKFALKNGFKKENLLTEESKRIWQDWLKKNEYIPDTENHDTIGMLALDMKGNVSGACTTSGLANKYFGRVGDSPIIGAGLYVDNDVGAAAATGKGEAVIKISGSFLIVELMRNGKSPKKACQIACERIIKMQKPDKDTQVGFIAVNKSGEIGAFSLIKGFEYALYSNGENKLIASDYLN